MAIAPKRRSTPFRRCDSKQSLLWFLFVGFAGVWALMLAVLHKSFPSASSGLYQRAVSAAGQSTTQLPQAATADIYREGAPPVIGTHRSITVDGRTTEFVYALPNSFSAKDSAIHGIALLLHGCSHSALKFFSPEWMLDVPRYSSYSRCVALCPNKPVVEPIGLFDNHNNNYFYCS